MEPKLYSDYCVPLSYLTEKESIIIMKNILKRTYNDEQNDILSHLHINCSIGWLDVFFILQYVDKCVINKIMDVIDNKKAPPGAFMKFSLIIQVLMAYSEYRDINRLLLKTFFDKKCFGLCPKGEKLKSYSQ